MSFQKSHRAKALASLVEAGPSISLDGQLQPPKSIIKPKKNKSKSATTTVNESSGIERLKGKGSGPSQAVEGDVDMGDNMEDQSDDEMLIDSATISLPILPSTSNEGTATTATTTLFQPLSTKSLSTTTPIGLKNEMRRIPIPPHRMTPLKKEWVNVYGPLVEMMGLVVRMNVKRKCVEMKVSVLFLLFFLSFRVGDGKGKESFLAWHLR